MNKLLIVISYTKFELNSWRNNEITIKLLVTDIFELGLDLVFKTRLSKKDPVLEQNVKNQGLFWKKSSKFGACFGFF